MTNTESIPNSAGNESPVDIDPGLAEGRSRLILFAGLGFLAIGAIFGVTPVVWSGVVLVGGAFALNTAGKLKHYWELPIPFSDRLILSASWLFLAMTVVGFLVNYVYARYGSGEANFFWSLVVASVGFGLLHMAAQSMYLPESQNPSER